MKRGFCDSTFGSYKQRWLQIAGINCILCILFSLLICHFLFDVILTLKLIQHR